MLPIRDNIPSRNYPVVNLALIGVNLLVFMLELAQGPDLNRFVYTYGLVPARYTVPEIASYFSVGQQLFSLVSFMFLHSGWLHVIGNMWSLYIFGDNVEDHLGSIRYLLFYLLCGFASGAAQMLIGPGANIPTIGASGAVAGVMGAYILLFPKAKILTLIPILFIPWFLEIPAFYFLGIWFLIQFFNAAGSIGSGGIAWGAHVGGFIFGMLCLKGFALFPEVGVSRRIGKITEKKKSDRLHTIFPTGAGETAVLRIAPHEVLTGTRKIVSIPTGRGKRLVRVTVPPGTREGTILRLRGVGEELPGGGRGDILLRVEVASIYRNVS